jgi:hypothetical protein
MFTLVGTHGRVFLLMSRLFREPCVPTTAVVATAAPIISGAVCSFEKFIV